ncbi:MAG: DUF4258 domain-containing protein [Leptospirales bacterium]
MGPVHPTCGAEDVSTGDYNGRFAKRLGSGEVIASYPDDTPYPSVLMLGYVQDRPLHVVAGRNPANEECIVVTVYVPDPLLWSEDFKTRRN